MTAMTRREPLNPSEANAYNYCLGIATFAHKDQTRKGGKIPYIKHCKDVANVLFQYGMPIEAICAGLLHDVVEDCDVTIEQLGTFVSRNIVDLVEQVTDIAKPEDGNRKARIAINSVHLSKCSVLGANIKLADILSNTKDIVETDPEFAPRYLQEKQDVLQFLKHGDTKLWRHVSNQIADGFYKLEKQSVGKSG